MTVTTPPMVSGQRVGTLTNVEVRTATDGTVRVVGHAAVWDTETRIGPPGVGFLEKVARGSFAKTISDGADVRLLFNHNPDLVLARTRSGSLTLREDREGLKVDANLAPTTVGRDLAVLLERGDVSQMSFGFQVVKDRWETEERDGQMVEVRTILEARLFDVSAVTYPAYDETDLAVREATLTRELRGVPTPAATEPALPTPLADEQAPQDPEPAPTTQASNDTDERQASVVDQVLRHANGAHRHAPRALCPACVKKSEPALPTPA